MKNLIGIFFLTTFALFAEQTTTIPSNKLTATSSAPSSGKIRGIFDMRPSYTPKIGEFHTENSGELGYNFSRVSAFFYRQEFNTNLYNPGQNSGLDATIGEGSVRFMDYNLVSFDNLPLSLGIEERLYLPTMERKRNAGMIASLRNYLCSRYSLARNVHIYLSETPTLHAYDRAGSGNSANPIFENKVDLAFEYVFTEKMRILLPLKFSSTRFRNYSAKARNNDSWSHFLYIQPELTYRISENYRVGATFYTAGLTDSNLSDLTVGDGFEKGIYQLFFTALL